MHGCGIDPQNQTMQKKSQGSNYKSQGAHTQESRGCTCCFSRPGEATYAGLGTAHITASRDIAWSQESRPQPPPSDPGAWLLPQAHVPRLYLFSLTKEPALTSLGRSISAKRRSGASNQRFRWGRSGLYGNKGRLRVTTWSDCTVLGLLSLSPSPSSVFQLHLCP